MIELLTSWIPKFGSDTTTHIHISLDNLVALIILSSKYTKIFTVNFYFTLFPMHLIFPPSRFKSLRRSIRIAYTTYTHLPPVCMLVSGDDIYEQDEGRRSVEAGWHTDCGNGQSQIGEFEDQDQRTEDTSRHLSSSP